jgi:hypothetical protein
MTTSEVDFALSKTEQKILTTLTNFGGQTKKDLILISEIQAEKVEEVITSLLEKGFVGLDETTNILFATLPFKALTTMITRNINHIEEVQEEQNSSFQESKNVVENQLVQFRENIKKAYEELQLHKDNLDTSLKQRFEEREKGTRSQVEDLVDQIITVINTNITDLQNESQTLLSDRTTSLGKHWSKAIDEFQNLPDSGSRTLKESIAKYEKELGTVITTSVDRIKAVQSQFNELFTSIESESILRIQEFFSNAENISTDLKTNLNTGLQESRKQEKEFINEVRTHVRHSLENNVQNALKKVFMDLSKDVDKEINLAIKSVVKQTELAIQESSAQIKTEFKEFATNASELIREQNASVSALSSEIDEISAEQKLTTFRDLFLSQLQVDISTELNQLEIGYRQAQQSAIDIVESLRRSSKSKLAQQSSDVEKLLSRFTEIVDQSLSRKRMDVTRLQQISHSIEQLLRNLLISIPMRSNQFRTSLRDSIETASTSLQEEFSESSVDSVNKIFESLSGTQQRIETVTSETLEESKNEIQKVMQASEQLQTTATNLQEEYLEKIEDRFNQRAKVMNTELEAVSRHFQQLLEGLESGLGDFNTRITSENITQIATIESSLQSKLTKLRNDITSTLSQSQSDAQEFADSLDMNLQTHLDRTLKVIKEGFSQVKSEFSGEIQKQLGQISNRNTGQQVELLAALDSFSQQVSLGEFRSSLEKVLQENQDTLNDFIVENRANVDEVLALQKSSITKYQEKGPTDILTFINQIQSDITVQNVNVKDKMEELLNYYDTSTDATMNEVSSLIRQVRGSGEKLKTILNDSLQNLQSNLNNTVENIDSFYSDTLTELENQLTVAVGFVTSEIDNSSQEVQKEIDTHKNDIEPAVESLNTQRSEIVAVSDQEFKENIPEITEEFSKVLEKLISDKNTSNTELQAKIKDNLAEFLKSYASQVSNIRTKLTDVLSEFGKSIDSNIGNLDTIVETNVDHALKRVSSVYRFDSNKEDPFGLQEIRSRVTTANKRLKSVVSESIRSQLESFEEKLPDLSTSFDAIHNQSEEDLTKAIDELADLISSSQMAITSQFHNYINEERNYLDFSETQDSLKDVLKEFSQTSNQNIEEISTDLTDSIQRTINEVSKSREEIEDNFTQLMEALRTKNSETVNQLSMFKTEVTTKTEVLGKEFMKNISTELDSYTNEIQKSTLASQGNTSQSVQTLNTEIETYLNTLLDKTSFLLEGLTREHAQQLSTLNNVKTELDQVKPSSYVKLLKLPSNRAISDYILEMAKSSSKQVTLYMSDPTILAPEELKMIPAEKRIWLYTNTDFSKKGKKWFVEVGNQVNINLRISKGSKVNGILAVRDDDLAVVLPDELGFSTIDTNFVKYLLNLINTMKGTSLRASKTLVKKG